MVKVKRHKRKIGSQLTFKDYFGHKRTGKIIKFVNKPARGAIVKLKDGDTMLAFL